MFWGFHSNFGTQKNHAITTTGSKKMTTFSIFAGNIKFPVSHSTEENLFPSPYVCPVLRVINHAAVIHGGDMEEFVEDRLKVEKALGK